MGIAVVYSFPEGLAGRPPGEEVDPLAGGSPGGPPRPPNQPQIRSTKAQAPVRTATPPPAIFKTSSTLMQHFLSATIASTALRLRTVLCLCVCPGQWGFTRSIGG